MPPPSPPHPGAPLPAAAQLGNFRDPVGLVGRMLRSGDGAARAALVREGLRVLATPLDLGLGWLERRRARTLPEPEPHPMLLIVGAPRSGTTLAHQVIARHLDVAYISNISSVFPRSALTTTKWMRGLRWCGPTTFASYYGQTRHWRAANDGFHVWDRWLGMDRYEPGMRFTPQDGESMRRFLRSWGRSAGAPLLNKNNRNTVCLGLLARELPEARFLVVRRDPLAVTQSLLRAREDVQGDVNVGWGLCSRDADASTGKHAALLSVCDQLLEVERKLEQGLEMVEPQRVLELGYEEFCQDPDKSLDTLCRFLPELVRRPGIEPPTPLRPRSQLRLTDDQLETACTRLGILHCPCPSSPGRASHHLPAAVASAQHSAEVSAQT